MQIILSTCPEPSTKFGCRAMVNTMSVFEIISSPDIFMANNCTFFGRLSTEVNNSICNFENEFNCAWGETNIILNRTFYLKEVEYVTRSEQGTKETFESEAVKRNFERFNS